MTVPDGQFDPTSETPSPPATPESTHRESSPFSPGIAAFCLAIGGLVTLQFILGVMAVFFGYRARSSESDWDRAHPRMVVATIVMGAIATVLGVARVALGY